ncbi:MAG: hypothetical protein QM765_20725 [Myxococcales bacterium]
MSVVAASEAELLAIARALVGELEVEAIEPIVRTRRTLAPKQGPTSMRLLEHTLAAGSVLQLARRGGWRSKRHLAGIQVVSGRFWELHPDTPLAFSDASIKILRWIHEHPMALDDLPAIPSKAPLTPADELVAYLACDLLVKAGCASAISRAGIFGRSALCWLGFPLEVRGTKAASHLPPEARRFAEFLAGPSAPLVEALQDDLRRRWVAVERGKTKVRDCATLAEIGRTQKVLLDAWLDALQQAGRQDLALFLVDAAVQLLPPGVTSRHFVGTVDPRAPLGDRNEARRSAGMFLRALLRIGQWVEQWRTTPFFEDTHASAQMLLGAFEPLGDAGLQRAQTVLHELETLDAGAHAPPAGPPPQGAGTPAATSGSRT